jgi:hypothetical protein
MISKAKSSCSSCGKPTGKPSREKAEAQEVLFTEFKKEAKVSQAAADKKSRETEKKKREKESAERRLRQKQELKNYILRNKIFLSSLGSLAGLFVVYAGGQAAINFLNGPEEILSEYVAAIKDSNWGALQDERLFPGSTAATQDYFKQSYSSSAVSMVSFGEVRNEGGIAHAEIFLDEAKQVSFKISLKSTPDRFFIFDVPNWKVSSKAPKARLSFADEVEDNHQISFGSQNPTEVISLGERDSFNIFQGSSSVLPGVYKVELGALGFYDSNSISKTIWAAGINDSLIVYPPSNQTLSGWMLDEAKSRANSLAENCASNRCDELPNYNVDNFDLWSQYPEDEYTYSTFSYDVSSGGCNLDSTKVNTYNSAELSFSCDLTVNAYLYVQYTYYYGYFSDYYYYWNFEDSTSTTIYPVIEISIDDAGDSVSIIKSGF